MVGAAKVREWTLALAPHIIVPLETRLALHHHMPFEYESVNESLDIANVTGFT